MSITIPVDPDSGREISRAALMAELGIGKSQVNNYAQAFEEVVGWKIPRRGPNRIYREWHLDVFLAGQALAPLSIREALATVLKESDGKTVGTPDESTEKAEPAWTLEHDTVPGEASNESLQLTGIPSDVLAVLRRSDYELAFQVLRLNVKVTDLEQQLKSLRAELKKETYIRDVGMEMVFRTSWSMRITGTWRDAVEWLSGLFRRA